MVGQMYAGRKEGAWYRVIVKNVIQSNHVSICIYILPPAKL